MYITSITLTCPEKISQNIVDYQQAIINKTLERQPQVSRLNDFVEIDNKHKPIINEIKFIFEGYSDMIQETAHLYERMMENAGKGDIFEGINLSMNSYLMNMHDHEEVLEHIKFTPSDLRAGYEGEEEERKYDKTLREKCKQFTEY